MWLGRNRIGQETAIPRSTRHAILLTLAGALLGLGMASLPAAVPLPNGPSLADLLETFRRPAANTQPAPADNPITPEKVALGKMLFFDRRLSGSGKIACASCHKPTRGWQDGRALGVGDHGAIQLRHTPTLLNIAWSEPLFSDGRAETLEEQAKGPLSEIREMNAQPEKAVAVLATIPGYRTAFSSAFPQEGLTVNSMVEALASFQRTLGSGIAPFDKWVEGDEKAVSKAAKRGFILFNTKAKCAACHSGWRFTDDGFHDIGLPDQDIGRAKIMPGLVILEHAFKTPTLRNIDRRAPYMHDGSLDSLSAVIDHYEGHYVDRPSLSPEMRRPTLTRREKADLVAFLHTLTSVDPVVTRPPLPRRANRKGPKS